MKYRIARIFTTTLVLALAAMWLIPATAQAGSPGPDCATVQTWDHSSSLAGMDATYCDLKGADLSGANLTATRLSNSDLTGADLSDATLASGIVGWATLTDVDLNGANLTYVSFRGSDLHPMQTI